MTNEELALLVQAGDASAMLPLWEQVRRLCWVMVRRYQYIAAANRAVDGDDLIQAAYIAAYRAALAYKPEEGAYASILGYCVKKECRDVLGLAGRERLEIYRALSLDAPISAEDDAATLADLVEDGNLPGATKGLEAQDMRRDVRQAVDALPDQQAAVMQGYYFRGMTLQQMAQEMGLSLARVQAIRTKAFRGLRNDKRIKRYYSDYCYGHKGVKAFFSSRTSTTEDAAFRIMEHQEILAASYLANWSRYKH